MSCLCHVIAVRERFQGTDTAVVWLEPVGQSQRTEYLLHRQNPFVCQHKKMPDMGILRTEVQSPAGRLGRSLLHLGNSVPPFPDGGWHGNLRPRTCRSRNDLVVAKSALLRFRRWRKLRALPCSSSPNRTRCAGLRFGFFFLRE